MEWHDNHAKYGSKVYIPFGEAGRGVVPLQLDELGVTVTVDGG
jgi:hypothetical protein